MTFASTLREFVVSCLEELVASHLPGFEIPRVFAGHEVGTDVRADLAFTLGLLGAGGIESVAGMPIEDALATVLGPTDGRRTHTFFSYRVAETVARYGTWDDNHLLARLSAKQRDQIAEACDSTSYIAHLDSELPRNYAAVLARCEFARAALGLPVDDAVLANLVDRTRSLLTANPGGYLDDSGQGRFDIYTADIYLFTEPFCSRLGSAWRSGAANAVALVSAVAAGNGAGITWGRSTGALSLCLTIELAGLAARHGLAGELPAARAFESLRPWFHDGLIAAHQYRSTYAYRGPFRRLQMTLDCLGKLTDAANALGTSTPAAVGLGPRNGLEWFDSTRNAGVWSYRSRDMAFVLPFVGGTATDYLSAPRNPGLFEVPVDSDLVTGVPVAFRRGVRYTAGGLPSRVALEDGALSIEHTGWVEAGHLAVPADRAVLDGGRRARIRVSGRTISVDEELTFEAVPHALALQVAETAGRPLKVSFEGAGAVTRIDTAGIKEYRSFWAELPVVHQIDLEPAAHVSFSWSVTPALRVMSTGHGHHYHSSLYGPLAARVVDGRVSMRALADWDQFHMHWPEWFLPRSVEQHRSAVDELRAARLRIVWTQHNLFPHDGDPGWEPVYELWAQAADVVIHHTEWGMARALDRWRYGVHTQHRVVPHGHFGNLASGPIDRASVEASLGLRSGVLRLGIVGAPRPAKRVDVAMDAVAACHRDDVELLVLSLRPGDPVPDDPRIVALPYEAVPRSDYNARLAAIDVLVFPFDDGDMLTTGTVGDAVGYGLPSLVSDWPFLAAYLGDAGIRYGRTASDLAARIDSLTAFELNEARQAALQLRSLYDWARVAELHFRVLEELGTEKL